MAETHCFIGTREVGKPKLRTTSSGASTASSVASNSRKSPQRISDILRLRRLRLNRAKTTTNSLSDSLRSVSDDLFINRNKLTNFFIGMSSLLGFQRTFQVNFKFDFYLFVHNAELSPERHNSEFWNRWNKKIRTILNSWILNSYVKSLNKILSTFVFLNTLQLLDTLWMKYFSFNPLT